jgi:hypothetical protein
LRTAREQLDRIHAESFGKVVGRGSFGSAGVSGSRPTAFVAVQTDTAAAPLMSIIGDRMQRAGFSPFFSCRPPAACGWERRTDNTLITAYAVVKTDGQPWGEESTAHGTVAPGARVLQLSMTVGG